MIDIEMLVSWLGRKGAVAGLTSSEHTVSDLVAIAKARGLPVDSKISRADVVNELVFSDQKKIDKVPDELMGMSFEELMKYLRAKRPTRTEILSLLSDLGVDAGSDEKKKLLDFAAREISELGMFSRIARGDRSRS